MQTTAATVLVLVAAILPGALGSYLYEATNGLHWRQSQWGLAIRYVAFSLFGLLMYVVGVDLFNWPPPEHVSPDTLASASLVAALPALVIPYLGHTAGGAIVGLLAAVAVRVLARFTSSSATPGTWSSFVKLSAPGRWVVVSLKSGDVYLGAIKEADSAVAADERDVLLATPAKLDDDGHYVWTAYADLFLQADLIQSIATLKTDAELDDATLSRTGQRVFKGAPHASETSASISPGEARGAEGIQAGAPHEASE